MVGGLNEIGAGLGLRRGERRGKKKEEAAPGDKGREAWGPGRERARAGRWKGGPSSRAGSGGSDRLRSSPEWRPAVTF